MKSIQDLVYRVADKDKDDPVRHGMITLTIEEMGRFVQAVIKAHEAKLLAGVGEPVAYRTEESTNGVRVWLFKQTAVKYQDPPDALYTADQMAAAVLREREGCAQIAWNYEPDENGPIEAAIRRQQ